MSFEVPVLDKDGDEWVLKVSRAGIVRIKDRALACAMWEAATWAHRNGAENARQKMRDALGVGP